jgi:hypothetical protein
VKVVARFRMGTIVRLLVILVFAVLCVMAVWQPQRWLFLFNVRSGRGLALMLVLFIMYQLARRD